MEAQAAVAQRSMSMPDTTERRELLRYGASGSWAGCGRRVDCGRESGVGGQRGYFKPLLSLKRSNKPEGILRLPRSQSCHVRRADLTSAPASSWVRPAASLIDRTSSGVG